MVLDREDNQQREELASLQLHQTLLTQLQPHRPQEAAIYHLLSLSHRPVLPNSKRGMGITNLLIDLISDQYYRSYGRRAILNRLEQLD
jgi:hypothetical protein